MRILIMILAFTTNASAQQLGDRPVPLGSRSTEPPMRLEADKPESNSARNGFDDPTPQQELNASERKIGTEVGEEVGEKESDKDDSAGIKSEQESESKTQQQRDLTLAHLMKLQKSVSEIRIVTGSNVPEGDRPANLSGEVFKGTEPQWVGALNSSWQPLSRYPVAFSHRPLYYQQPELERCGRTVHCGSHSLGCLQNAVSGFTFLANTMVLPYRLATERPDCPVPSQGDCRACQTMGCDCDPLQPGTCGVLTEAAAIAGFTFLLL